MADYRRGLMDMTPEERQKVAPGFVPKTDVSKPLSVQAADAAVSLTTPIDSIVDIQEELKKEQPDYVKIGLMAAGEAVGLIPAVGDVAQSMIRKGTDSVIEVASNVPKVSRQVSNTDYDKRVASLDEAEDAVSWQNNAEALVKELRETSPTIRTPELEESAQALRDQRITREQHLENVNTYKPVASWDALPREPSNKATVFSLKPDQREKGRFILPADTTDALGVTQSGLKVGDRFNGRLDIPAYQRFDTWIVAGTSNAEKGVTHYAKAIHYKGVGDNPVRFAASQKKGEKIGTGEEGKTGYATVSGEIKDLDADAIREKAATLLNDPEWTQVGFDPRRQSSFYVRGENNRHVPVREADEVIQIGPLVLAKNAKLDMEYSGYNEGGMAMDEQTEAVFKSSRAKQVDPVSGNEVPTGSLPEEVRDDIPAQLSEGEYVVPADVVRYYGVKFFEDLRGQAKEGWSDMEENGRIGGDPIGPEGMEMVEPEDDLPFDVSELEVREYNEGGMVGQPISNTGLEAIFSNPTSNIEQKQYVGPNGEIMMLTFINGEPDAVAQYYIDEGYKPATESTQETETPTTTDPTASANEVLPTSQDDQTDYNAFQNEKEQVEERAPKFANKSVDELIAYGDQLVGGTLGKAAMGVTALNPMLGSLASVARRAEIFNVAKGLKEKYEQASSDEERKKIDDAFQNITSRGKEKGGGVLGGGGLLGGGGVLYDVNGDGKVDFGDTWLGDLLGFDGEAGVQGPSQKDSWNGARRVGGTGTKSITSLAEFYKTKPGVKLGTGPRLTSGATTSPTTSQTRASSPRPKLRPDSGGSNDNGPSHSEIMASHNAMREARAASANKALSNNSTSSVIAKSKDKAATSAEASKVKEKLENMSKGAAGGFHKGGLMAKKT